MNVKLEVEELTQNLKAFKFGLKLSTQNASSVKVKTNMNEL